MARSDWNPHLNGLRGYLALCVFFHHAAIWFQFLRQSQWSLPPSTVLTNMGHGSVAIFFMMTGYLFFSRLLDREQPLDWPRLYVGRFLRLVPLYLLCVSLTFVVVAILSDWKRRAGAVELALQGAHWLAFTMFGAPDINQVPNTSVIMAAAVWALPYEIVFYALLPLLAAVIGRRVPLLAFLPVGLAVWYLVTYGMHSAVVGAFAGGMFAAVLQRIGAVRDFAPRQIASWLVLACVCAVLFLFDSAYAFAPLSLLTLAFCVIVSGNDLFGLLSWRFSQALGRLAYPIFLLHGLLLFTVIQFGLGAELARSLSPLRFGLLVFACAPPLVLLAFAVSRLVDEPIRSRADWLSARLSQRSAVGPR